MDENRPVLVSGATGLVGRRLLARLEGRGTPVRALSRSPSRARLPAGTQVLGWNGIDVPVEALRGTGAIVHLAGEPIFGGLPSAARKERMHASRILSTESLAAGLARLGTDERPDVLVCASAVGYYGDRGDEELHEAAAPGSGFLAELCCDWEEAARRTEAHGVRVVSLRIGIVLAREGGALATLVRPFRLGLGGPLGGGRQWVPWIQADDLVRLVEAACADSGSSGPLNAVAPNPVRNRELTATLGRLLRRPALLPVPAFVLRAALGELAEELLASRRVIPARAEALGFHYEHPDLDSALRRELGGPTGE